MRLIENNKEPENLIVTIPYMYLEISDAYLTPISLLLLLSGKVQFCPVNLLSPDQMFISPGP